MSVAREQIRDRPCDPPGSCWFCDDDLVAVLLRDFYIWPARGASALVSSVIRKRSKVPFQNSLCLPFAGIGVVDNDRAQSHLTRRLAPVLIPLMGLAQQSPVKDVLSSLRMKKVVVGRKDRAFDLREALQRRILRSLLSPFRENLLC